MLDKQKIVAIHQPNYFPWLGFFYKISASDIFVYHDNVEHSKKYPTRRTNIRKSPNSDDNCWITVPLKKHNDFTLIKDLQIDQSQDWRGKHLRKIRNSYSSAPFFNKFIPLLERWFEESKRYDLLSDLNIFLVENILEWLGINREVWRSSELPVKGSSSTYNVELVKYLKGTAYLSGKGSKNYQKDNDFSIEGIECKTSDFGKWVSTKQFNNPFISNSVIEAACYFSSNQLLELFRALQLKHGSHTLARR